MENLTQAKDFIEKAKDILILAPQNPSKELLGMVFGLFYTLKKIGKNVNIVTEKNLANFYPSTDSYSNSNIPKDFIISINTLNKDVDKMRYEKNEEDLKIYLTLKRGNIEEKDIFLNSLSKNIKEKSDLLIIFEGQNLKELKESCDKDADFFYKIPVLAIGNFFLNEDFSDNNLLEVDFPSLAEILINPTEPQDKTLLGKDITPAFFNNPFLPFITEEKISNNPYKKKDVPSIMLLRRVLEKLEFDKKNQLLSVCLTNKDFKESKTTFKNISFIIKKLIKSNFRESNSSSLNLLILWERGTSSVKGVFYSNQPALVKKIAKKFQGTSKEKGVLFLVKNTNFDSIKKEIISV